MKNLALTGIAFLLGSPGLAASNLNVTQDAAASPGYLQIQGPSALSFWNTLTVAETPIASDDPWLVKKSGSGFLCQNDSRQTAAPICYFYIDPSLGFKDATPEYPVTPDMISVQFFGSAAAQVYSSLQVDAAVIDTDTGRAEKSAPGISCVNPPMNCVFLVDPALGVIQ